jgi:hypothetical protein
MPRDGSLTVGDLVEKNLDYLEVTCTKCPRRGRYSVARLLERHGADAKLTDWKSDITADCPRAKAAKYSDWCGANTPGLVALFGSGARRKA